MIAIILIILATLVTAGLIVRIKSFSSGRIGPGLFQPFKNVWVLLRKGVVYSDTSGIITKLSPVVVFASVLLATFMVPVAGFRPLISFNGDFILFAYLLSLARFMMIIAAFDTGSSFGGMGASREALFGMLIEPALFILIAGLVVLTGEYSMAAIFHLPEESYSLIYGLIVSYIIGNITIVENSRVPVDDPKTHLELTMIHEVMILDTSSFNLALIQITSFLKFALFGSLIASSIIPREINPGWQILFFFIIQGLFALVTGLIESFRPRYRMNRNQEYILTVTLISAILFVVILFTKNVF
jgi:formate hydrogenlyase subunit 4